MESTASSVKVGKGNDKRSRWPIVAAAFAGLVFLGGTLYLINTHSLDEAKAADLAPAQIQITQDGFTPATVKVKKGQQVTITNADGQSHQLVTTDGMPAFDGTTTLQKDESLTVTTEQTGTFTYHDALSTANFNGTIIVE
jgi:plastocyanin